MGKRFGTLFVYCALESEQGSLISHG